MRIIAHYCTRLKLPGQTPGSRYWTKPGALLCLQEFHSPVRRLINTFQGRVDVPLADVKRRHHLKGEYRLEGVHQVGSSIKPYRPGHGCQVSVKRKHGSIRACIGLRVDFEYNAGLLITTTPAAVAGVLLAGTPAQRQSDP